MKRLIETLGILALVAAGVACSSMGPTKPDPSPVLAHRSAAALRGARPDSLAGLPEQAPSGRSTR
jgi:hypothetical protein